MKYLSVEVVICHTTTNFKFDQSVFATMTVRHIFEISEDDRVTHSRSSFVGHARDI
jgi:hypothetical protein